LANPEARRTIAPRVTLETACGLLGVEVRELVAALEAARQEQARQEQTHDDTPSSHGACCDACSHAAPHHATVP
jgi:hypothetical protein